MRTIAVLNQKGGVGKTTTTVNTAAALATMGQRVVVIDLDPQGHLTIHLGIEPQELKAGSYEVLTQSASFEESLMLVRPNLWALAANINLVGAETELVNVVGREIILREAMQASADRFDFCLIDCAPSLGLLSLNALAAAQEVLIPLQPHFLALQGFGKLLQTVDLVSKRINRDLKVSGVLLCMFDTRASLPNEVRADIMRFLENARGSACAWAAAELVPTFIRRNIKLAEAPSYGRTIFEYDPTCNGAEDYRRVAQFFLGIEPEPVAIPEAESQPQPVGANDHSPAAPSNGSEEAEAQSTETAGPMPSAPRELEPEPLIEHEFANKDEGATDREAPSDMTEVDGNDEREDVHLPPVAEADPPVEMPDPFDVARRHGASPPEPEPGSDTPNEAQPEDTAPIEIRAFEPPALRRYTPPPLQPFPAAPSSRHEPERHASDPPGEGGPDESQSPA